MLNRCLDLVKKVVGGNLVSAGTGLATWASVDSMIKGGETGYSSSAMALSGLMLASAGHHLERRETHKQALGSSAIYAVLGALRPLGGPNIDRMQASMLNGGAPNALAESLRLTRGIGVMGFLMHLGSSDWATFTNNQLLIGAISASADKANRSPLPAEIRDVQIPHYKLRYLLGFAASWLLLSETKKWLNGEDMSPLDITLFSLGGALTLTEVLIACKLDAPMLAADVSVKPAIERFNENKQINTFILTAFMLTAQDIITGQLNPYSITADAYLILVAALLLISQIILMQATQAVRARDVVQARPDQVQEVEANAQPYARMDDEGDVEAQREQLAVNAPRAG